MAKKKFSLSVSYDAPVTLTFSLISLLVFIIFQVILKSKNGIITIGAPTMSGGESPFVFANPLCYFRMIIHVFSAETFAVLISNLMILLLLGPVLEEYYGSVIVGIMMIVSALLSGVLNACFCKHSATGSESIVFMLILLNGFISVNKKKIPLASVFVLILFIVGQCKNGVSDGLIIMITNIAGGLCGSLLAFMASPKVRATKKNSKSSDKGKTKAEIAAEIDAQSPRFKKNNRDDDDDDETTVIGTIKF